MSQLPRRPWYQFSLRTMFVLTVVACVLSWLTSIVYNFYFAIRHIEPPLGQ